MYILTCTRELPGSAGARRWYSVVAWPQAEAMPLSGELGGDEGGDDREGGEHGLGRGGGEAERGGVGGDVVRFGSVAECVTWYYDWAELLEVEKALTI